MSDPNLEARQITPTGSTVLRHRLGRGRVQLSNSTVQGRTLSYRAKGLLAEMVSRPPDWRFSVDRLAANSPAEGRDAVNTAMRELEDAGYVLRKPERGRDGKIATTVRVSDVPILEWAAYAAAKRGGSEGTVDDELPEAGEPYAEGYGEGYPIPHPMGHRDPWESILPPVAPDAAEPLPAGPVAAEPSPVDPWAIQGQEYKEHTHKDSDHNGRSAAGGNSELRSGLRARGTTPVDAGVSRTPFADLQALWDSGEDDDAVYEGLHDLLGGYDDATEMSTILGMLDSGSHIKAVYNKIIADREGR